MFGRAQVEEQRFRLKPMNCPGHILIYKSRLHSYRDLPIRYSEFGTVYRFERSGVLHGLTRVRGFTQDDAHLFCTPDQLQGEFEQTLDEARRLMNAFGFGEFAYVLSTREPDARGETDADRRRRDSQSAREVTTCRTTFDEGGGAFYGPKLDINVRDAIGRIMAARHRASRFRTSRSLRVKIPGADGQDHTPVMIHRALAGSLERFFGILIEHYGGAFPAWLAPVQVDGHRRSPEQLAYAREVGARLELRSGLSGPALTKATRSSATKFGTGKRKRCRIS